MLTKVFARAVKASFHCGNTCGQNFGDFRMAAALLHQREEGAVLRAKLGECVTQGIQFLGIDRARGFWNVFVLFAKRLKNPAQFLPAELVDAGVARQPEQPRLELRRRLQTIQGADHLDKNLLRQVFDVIASARHGVNESRDAMLVADDELTLGDFLAALSPADEVGQRSR